MNRRVQAIAFFATIALFVVALQLCNQIPEMVGRPSVEKYISLEQAQSALGREALPIPTYFSKRLTWPPAEILALRSPGSSNPAVVVHFRDATTREIALAIAQPNDPNLPTRLSISRQLSTTEIYVNTHLCVQIVGLQQEGLPCNRLTCGQGEFSVAVTGTLPVAELERITGSLLSRR